MLGWQIPFRELLEVWEARDLMYLQELIEEQEKRIRPKAWGED